jgi:hypothetical protein
MRVVDRRRYDTEGQVRRLRSGFPLVNETEQRLGAMSLEVAEREFSHANSVKKCQSRGVPRCSTVVLHRQKPAVREMPDSEGLFRHRKSVADRERVLRGTRDSADFAANERHGSLDVLDLVFRHGHVVCREHHQIGQFGIFVGIVLVWGNKRSRRISLFRRRELSRWPARTMACAPTPSKSGPTSTAAPPDRNSTMARGAPPRFPT